MRCGITGGAGFIGGYVASCLDVGGDEPVVIDRAHGVDILDYDALVDRLYGCCAVVHLAGILGTDELFDTPELAVHVNVLGSLNVLEACRLLHLRYVGITMPDVFPSIYTATKVGAARLATAYHHSHHIPVSHVRAFNAFGPGQAHGEGHPRKIIPSFASEAWLGEPITIWGDGDQTVDLVHARDLGYMLATAAGPQFGDNEVLDGGTGKAFTVNEVAEMVIDITGSTAGTRHLPMRRGEHPTNIVAAGDGWDLLGWKPEFDFDELAETVRSYRP